MKKTLSLLSLLLLFCFAGFAQIDEQETSNSGSLINPSKKNDVRYDISDKVMLGGNMSLTFGSMSMVEVSPLIGYNLSPRVTLGASLTYMYFSYKSDLYSYSAQNFGGGLFGKIRIYKDFHLQIEPELLNIKYVDYNGQEKRKWVFNALAGVTFRSRLGERFAVDYSILWNLNQTQDSPYDNPVIKVAFVY